MGAISATILSFLSICSHIKFRFSQSFQRHGYEKVFETYNCFSVAVVTLQSVFVMLLMFAKVYLYFKYHSPSLGDVAETNFEIFIYYLWIAIGLGNNFWLVQIAVYFRDELRILWKHWTIKDYQYRDYIWAHLPGLFY